MSIWKGVFYCVCLVGLTQLVWGQNGNSSGGREHGIPGYLDPQTRTFTTQAQAEARGSATPDSVTVLGGIWFIDLTITLTTSPASGDVVTCSGTLDVSDPNFGYFENASIVATVTGGTATCNVEIPYTWSLMTPSTDIITVSYDVAIIHDFVVGTSTKAVSTRESSHTITSITGVPPGGTHTTTSASPRL